MERIGENEHLATVGLRVEPGAHGVTFALEVELPAAGVHTLQLQLPALTRGEGVLETAFARYAEVRS